MTTLNFTTRHHTPISVLMQDLGLRRRYCVSNDGCRIDEELISQHTPESVLMYSDLGQAKQAAYALYTEHHSEQYRANQALVDKTSVWRLFYIKHIAPAEIKQKTVNFFASLKHSKELSEMSFDHFCENVLQTELLPETALVVDHLNLHQPLFVLTADAIIGHRSATISQERIESIWLRKLPDTPLTYTISYSLSGRGEFHPESCTFTESLDDGEIPYSAINVRVFLSEQQAVNALHGVLSSAQCHLVREGDQCFTLTFSHGSTPPLAEQAEKLKPKH